MLYAIIARDADGSLEQRRATRPAHIQRLTDLRDQGRLVLAGPFPAVDSDDPGDAGFSGSLIVAEFASLEEAHAWAATDPYRAAGVYEDLMIKPFLKALP